MMTEFKVLKVSSEALYAYELASYIAPYATIGSLILAGFSLASEQNQERRLEEISKKLDEIKSLLVTTRQALEQKLNDIPLKERTGEVLGMGEVLQENATLRSDTILANLVTDSAQTKQKIAAYINAQEVPVFYRAAYCSLYASLLPLRIAAFKCFDLPNSEINTLVKSELNDLLSAELISIDSVEQVGRRRVSARRDELYLIDELGPVFGTSMTVTVDNRDIPVGLFVPRQGNLSEIRDVANRTIKELSDEKAAAASAPIRSVMQAARAALSTLV